MYVENFRLQLESTRRAFDGELHISRWWRWNPSGLLWLCCEQGVPLFRDRKTLHWKANFVTSSDNSTAGQSCSSYLHQVGTHLHEKMKQKKKTKLGYIIQTAGSWVMVVQSTLVDTLSKGQRKIYVLIRLTCKWSYLLVRVNHRKAENAIFLRVIELFDVNVRMYAKNDPYGCGFKIYLLTGGIALSEEKTSTCNIEFYVLSGEQISYFWITFTLIFYWRKSGYSRCYLLTRFTCMWGSC